VGTWIISHKINASFPIKSCHHWSDPSAPTIPKIESPYELGIGHLLHQFAAGNGRLDLTFRHESWAMSPTKLGSSTEKEPKMGFWKITCSNIFLGDFNFPTVSHINVCFDKKKPWMFCEEKKHDLVQTRLINQDGAIETVPFHCGLWVTIWL
jgi:hypothetical protein